MITREEFMRDNIDLHTWQVDAIWPLIERLQNALQQVVNIGHNDDCMFCGFKDKVVQEGLK